ncbi:sensor histidine kinase [Actinomadura litoris]|uniref:sensor histidine kinase n=1 Tax=Actinomadura litoris TaxID=2678616 RepID=UPI001FA6F628|nr:sensor histidine kinase [Actinomadura litoris]
MNASNDTASGARPASSPGRRGLSVRSWFMLAALIVGVLTVTAALVVHSQLDRTTRASDRLVDRIAPAQIEAARTQMAMLNQETGVRGYALSGDRQYLRPYTDGLATERESTDRLRRLLADEPRLLADVEAAQRAIQTWRRDYGSVVIGQVAERGPGKDASATASRSKPAFDAVRATWAVQNGHLSEARAEGHAELRHTRTVRNWTMAALFAVLLLTAVLLAALLHYTVGRPLRMLSAASRRVADGDFSHEIDAHGPADVRDVAAVVEAMRRRITLALAESTERERLLRHRTEELDAQTVELRRSNAELEQFAYVASHDLQEPLRKVASFSQMLERRYADQLDDRARQYIGFAVDGAKRMQVLINDLLTFSRVGRLNQQRQETALRAPLERALDNLDDVLSAADARVEVPDDLPTLTADPMLLTMLWQNLIGNAVKFRDPERPAVVTIGCAREDDLWHLTVTDNGIGIAADYAEKIFVIFQRLHSREAYSGTGIGLALCKKIVEYHGGKIWLDPDYHDGARFHFTLAAQPDTADPGDPEPAADEADARPGTADADPASTVNDDPSSTADPQGATR